MSDDASALVVRSPGRRPAARQAELFARPVAPVTPGPDLAGYDVILVNISGGKDSQATLDVTVRAAEHAGVRDRVMTVFADLGDDDEWPGTRELAAAHAAHYGVPHVVVRREVTNAAGERVPQSLSEHIEQRGMWPDAARRYCTSDAKRAPVHRLMTSLAAERRALGAGQVRILNVMGLRAQESPARALLRGFSHDERASNSRRWVDTWLPVHLWPVEQVWALIAQAGTRPHWVYAAGLPRLSCRFCVLASRSALIRAAQLDPAGADKRAGMEQRMGHRFRNDLTMREIVALAAVTPAAGPVEDWRA
jgi:3'-phosphoadenosine 5'-phosphosulfate sulfotransferase (PAPS reductase)/FAD synthetase